jgi:hypothetical protein
MRPGIVVTRPVQTHIARVEAGTIESTGARAGRRAGPEDGSLPKDQRLGDSAAQRRTGRRADRRMEAKDGARL